MGSEDKRQTEIATRIRETLTIRDMGQADLARAIGVTPTTMWKYLDGQTGIDKKLLPIARALGVSADWLENGGEDRGDPHTQTIESFISEIGPTLRPPLNIAEQEWVRRYPHHRVTQGKLLDMVRSLRDGLTSEEAADSAQITGDKRAAGAKLGTPKLKRS
jgi:transcriptional regulator with XRE-family HTH domain